MKKKVLAVILGAVMVASMAGCGGSDTKTTDTAATETTDSTDDAENTETAEATDGESYTIGISQFAEHGSLDNCREGFLEGLKEEGIEEGKNLTVKVNNADADMGTASEIAQSCVEKILLKVIDGVHTGKKQKYSWLTPKRIAEYYAQSMCYIVMNWIQSGMTISARELAEIYDYIIKRSMEDILAEL